MLIKTLKETGLDDNTIIVFSGDHGDMLGERNLWYKMSFFEGSARVPMIVHAPNRFTAKRVKESVSTIDLLPTFLEMATGTSNHEYAMPIQGRSLMPHIQGKSDAHDEVIGEYFGEGVIAPLLMIRRAQYKYVYCHIDPEQLFDLDNDPNELVNLATNPEYADLLRSFKKETLARWDSDALTQDVVHQSA